MIAPYRVGVDILSTADFLGLQEDHQVLINMLYHYHFGLHALEIPRIVCGYKLRSHVLEACKIKT